MPIRVTLINPKSRRYFLAQWDDPVTGKTRTRSTEHTVRRDAERFAARLEDELNSGEYAAPERVTWEDFRKRYLSEVSDGKALKTKLKTQAMFNAMDELIAPKYLASISASVCSQFQSQLRERLHHGHLLSPATIHGHLRELRKVLRWAKNLGLIQKMPHIEFPRGISRMKGRPITAEEFDRFLATIPKHVANKEFLPGWVHMARGLWLSGLRLEEAMLLHWTSQRHLSPDFSHKRPMFRIQADSEKARTFRLLPMTPDFAAFLNETPPEQRRGFIFNPTTVPRGRRTGSHRPTANHVGRVFCAIGETAGIRVTETKYASAHDFRRAFGYRWAKLVMPKVLMELMRHSSINTTMVFYVGQMAEDAADAVWNAAHATGNTFGNTQPKQATSRQKKPNKTP